MEREEFGGPYDGGIFLPEVTALEPLLAVGGHPVGSSVIARLAERSIYDAVLQSRIRDPRSTRICTFGFNRGSRACRFGPSERCFAIDASACAPPLGTPLGTRSYRRL